MLKSVVRVTKKQILENHLRITTWGNAHHRDKVQIPRANPELGSDQKFALKPKTNHSAYQYCIGIVKKHDYEGYLTTLLLPERTRRAFFAIRAFNVEVATIRENITFKETGLGRLAFWRDAIDHLFGKYPTKSLPRHPVIQELSGVIGEGALSKRWFTNLVESRQETMTDSPFRTLADLETYSEKSVAPIFYIIFDYLGLKSNHLDHAASHFGKTMGITNFIRSLPHSRKTRRILVPNDLLLKHNLSQENFIRLDETEKIQNLVFEMASQSVAHYEHAKTLKEAIGGEIQRLGLTGSNPEVVFMAALPSKFYLERLEKCGFSPYHPSLTRRYGLLPWLLIYNKFRKRYY